MYKVTWSKKFTALGDGTGYYWAYKDYRPETHTKEYAHLNDIYGDVEVAWGKGYVPRVIEHNGVSLHLSGIRNAPRYIGSVYGTLKSYIDDIKRDGGVIVRHNNANDIPF